MTALQSFGDALEKLLMYRRITFLLSRLPSLHHQIHQQQRKLSAQKIQTYVLASKFPKSLILTPRD